MARLPSGKVTFLFTDIEGSTRLLDELGEADYETALADHRAKLRGAFARHGGVEVDTQGDAFFYAFADAREAVTAASDAQAALAEGPIKVRIGLHSGEPRLTAEGYVGREVHRGARIAAAGHGGQVLLSKETSELIDVPLTDLGEHRLKDFAEPVWIYQLDTERFPPLKTISNTNLPRPASSFVGREREVAEITALLSDGVRLITLTGPGGTGKTRLSIEAAAELIPEFRNGVFWVDLASLSDPALALSTAAQAIGAKEPLVRHIGERQMLLVLDNFEQVVASATELATVVSACPNLRVLVTSRELLRIRGEVEYAVPPLTGGDAATLFASRSGLPADKTVTELCRRLDMLPLAIELAAARTSVLSPAQILERLSQRLDLLKGGRDAESRQRTLRATIAWSHDLLNEEERRLFARLAVFRGGWTIEAAAEVVHADLDVLGSLVDKSLVQHSGERFGMLETVREYALERLAKLDEGSHLRAEHARYFLDLSAAMRNPAKADVGAWARLLPDHDNVRGALEWTVETTDRARGISALRSLWPFWLLRGFVAEGNRWAQLLLELPGAGDTLDEGRAMILAGELARFSGDLARAASLKAAALERVRGNDDEMYAATLRDLALISLALGDVKAAEGYASEALTERRRSPSPHGLAHALEGRAHVEWHKGNTQDAIRLMEEAVSHLIEAGDEMYLSGALEALADFQRRSGNLSSATGNLTRALTISIESGDLFDLAWCLRGTGSLLADLGRTVAAARTWGALDSLLSETGLSFAEYPSDFAAQTEKVRRLLGQPEYASEFGEGQSMSHLDASHYALSALGDVTS